MAQFFNELAAEKKAVRRVDLDALEDDAEEEVCCTFTFPLGPFDFNAVILLFFALQKKSEASEAGSQAAEEDYDVDEEYDNDYADNYFDNGEGDDLDDLGGGGGGDPSGGGELGSSVGS